MAVSRERRALLASIGIVALILVAATAYAGAGVTGQAVITWPRFFGLLTLLTLANGWLLLTAWRQRHELGPYTHIALIAWGGVAIWYWVFAPVYYGLIMNFNSHQVAWTALAFLWEVPVIGGAVLISLGLLLFRPIARTVTTEPPPDPEAVYRRIIRYPGHMAVLLFCLSVVGYSIGALQLGLFAAVSDFELIKSVLNGPIVSVFLSIFYYLTFDTYLDRYRRKISRHLPDQPRQVRNLRYRITNVSLAVLLGNVGLLGLLVLQSFQHLEERSLRTKLLEDVVLLHELAENNPAADVQLLARGSQGYVTIIPPHAVADLPVSAETKVVLASEKEGVVRDLHGQGKMLAFTTRSADNSRVISVVYLTNFYNFLQPSAMAGYAFGSMLVVALTMAVFVFVAYEITRALASLRAFAQHPQRSRWDKLIGVHTGDEIEAVGHSFMRYVQKAREVDRVKREFVSIASHQLRTPLTAINWYIELLKSGREGTLNEKQQQDLGRIERGSRRMVRLVNNLLNVSRLESGRLSIQPQETNLAAFVQELVEEVTPQAKEAHCEIVVTEHITETNAWIDGLLLRQVMQNVLTNAIKYRSRDRVCRIMVQLGKNSDGEFVLSVTDNGVGIPRSQQHRVFDKFFRGDNVATLDTEGTGLGLYVSKMLLEEAGCSISFKSERGNGTTFTITIPAAGMLAKPGAIGLT